MRGEARAAGSATGTLALHSRNGAGFGQASDCTRIRHSHNLFSHIVRLFFILITWGVDLELALERTCSTFGADDRPSLCICFERCLDPRFQPSEYGLVTKQLLHLENSQRIRMGKERAHSILITPVRLPFPLRRGLTRFAMESRTCRLRRSLTRRVHWMIT